MKLIELDPHFLKPMKRAGAYSYTDNIDVAVGLVLRCPACHWTFARDKRVKRGAHMLTLWKAEAWDFEGGSYTDLSVKHGHAEVAFSTGCRSQFTIKHGKVDFA